MYVVFQSSLANVEGILWQCMRFVLNTQLRIEVGAETTPSNVLMYFPI